MAKRNNMGAHNARQMMDDAASMAPEDGVAVETPRKTRRKFPTILMEEFTDEAHEADDGRKWPGLRRVADSPDFDDAAAALKWAQEKNLSGVFHPIIDKGAYRLETEHVRKTTINQVFP